MFVTLEVLYSNDFWNVVVAHIFILWSVYYSRMLSLCDALEVPMK